MILSPMPSSYSLGLAVMQCKEAIVGHYDNRGHKVTVFSTVRARNMYKNHVSNVKWDSVGEFTQKIKQGDKTHNVVVPFACG